MKWWQIRKRDADLERELQSDLQLEEEEQREHGIAPEEARYAALRAFGNPSVISEQTREVWSWDRLETFLRDLRIIIRTLARQPGFSTVAMLVIAVGIGATVSLFTVVWSVLLKPLPFDRPDELVRLYETSERFPANGPAPGIFPNGNARVGRSPASRCIRTGRSTTCRTAARFPNRFAAALVPGTCSPRLVSSPLSGARSPPKTINHQPTAPSSSVGLFGNAALAATLPSSAAKSILTRNPTPSSA